MKSVINAIHRRSSLARAGQAMALLGGIIFLVAGQLSYFHVNAENRGALSSVGAVKEVHRAALSQSLATLDGQWFSSAKAFSESVDARIGAANQDLDADHKIWDYDRQQYTLAFVRYFATGTLPGNITLFFWLTFGLTSLGGLIYAWARFKNTHPGVKNDGVMTSSSKSRGIVGIILGVILIAFYVLLYFYPQYIVNYVRMADPISGWLRNKPADRWFFYGWLYTLAVVVMGVRMAVNYRHNRYQLVRTGSVFFFQVGFAFLIPGILEALNKPGHDFKLAWPLDYSFFYSYNLQSRTSGDGFGWFVLFWGIALSFIAVPALAAFFGKRWYCSWVCGCGGLAETLGDPFRHLSDKSLKAWKVERYLIHAVLVFAVILTGLVITNHFTGMLGSTADSVKSTYGFMIGSVFAGVVGTGFYPLMGNRVWCRFGCPLAAILGMVQKFKSRFRITVNGAQCISCGNCSTYCEMGIDVRAYAQRGQNIVRSSCVGCGVCATVCPRGVLRLENGPTEGRYNKNSLVQLGRGPIDG